ncbi:MAG: DUF885 domain-containing protein [Acidimicrobiia bacterium]|nr:DUF885 domain-containing protein [Acidimicrobiia bacterium]
MASPFELSERLVDDTVALSPVFATSLGVPGSDHLWGDLGLAGAEARYAMARRYRTAFAAHVDHDDQDQRVAARILTKTAEEWIEAHEAGDHLEDLSHMASTFQNLRSIFDVMDVSGNPEGVCSRLETIGSAFDGIIERLDEGRRRSKVVAERQVRAVLKQARALAGHDSAFTKLVARSETASRDRLVAAIDTARQEAARFADYLESTYLPDARPDDGAGEERYRRAAERMVGIAVDPAEAYEWGWGEIDRLLAEMRTEGERILPGARFAEVTAHLESADAESADSPEDFVAFISDRLATALADLSGVHFDVPEQIRDLTVQIAPPGGALGAYYMRPSEDFTRSGGVWYSIGDQTRFPLYHQVSTAYHEGFPGHHLQLGIAMTRSDRISRGQRTMVWYPGHGEGWALYAERLMDELGYLETPAYRYGMFAKHMYRAARVVVDIGLHLGLQIPAGAPAMAGEFWTFERAVEFMETYGFRTHDQAVSEVTRYLGWPGQAISYKLGEREILAIRAEAMKQPDYQPKTFHERVLGHGAMRLDTLREVVLG